MLAICLGDAITLGIVRSQRKFCAIVFVLYFFPASLAKENAFSSKEIIKKLQLDWSTRKMTSYLKKLENIEVLKSKPLKFQLKNNAVKTLF